MHMAAIALYSSSPPTAVWSTQGSRSGSNGGSFDADIHSRHVHHHHSAVPRSGSVVGGLSGLFASNRSTSQCSGGADVLDCGPGMVRSGSGDSLSHLAGSWDCYESRSGSLSNGYLHKHKDRSPVSVLHGPVPWSNHTSSSAGHSALGRDNHAGSSALPPLDPHSDRRRTRIFTSNPVARSVGFEVEADQSLGDGHLRRSGSDSIAVRNFNYTGSQLQNLRHTITLDGDLGRVVSPFVAATEVEVESNVLEEARGRFDRLARESAEVSPDSDLFRSAVSAEELLADAQERHRIFYDDTVIKAFFMAEEAHRGQLRRSGDLYLSHCVETAILLANTGADSTVVAAGLLHDSLDDGCFTPSQLSSSVGEEINALVAGVGKLSACSQLARDNATAFNPEEADRLRTMFLAMVDVRVVLIKLADRLHNLRTLDSLPVAKQLRVAQETLEIFVPIANRLGIFSWKAEMEDLCFRHLKPREYNELASNMSLGWKEGVMSSLLELEAALRKGGIEFADICGRPKNLYSIYSKMARKGRAIDEIFDVRGLRLIVKNVKDCYAALKVVHNLWAHSPKGLKNYIASPKANGYQSLHTVVLHKDGHPIEVQIRTVDMHHQAEYGMAAHWRYKESDSKYSSFVQQKVEWARWVLTWHSEILDAKLRVPLEEGKSRATCPFPSHVENCRYAKPGSLPPNGEDDPLFIIMLKNENMIVQELMPGATTADVLLKSSGNISPTSIPRRAKVNNEFVENFQQKLRMGDLVEITLEAESPPVALSSPKRTQVVHADPSEQNLSEIALEFQREQLKRMYLDHACSEEAMRGLPQSQGSSAGIASLS